MLKVFNWASEDFSGNGIAILNEARDVKIHKEINGEWTLSFSHAQDEKWKYIATDNIILTDDGQRFRIKRAEGESVTAVPVYKDAAGKHLPATSDMIGSTPYAIMTNLFNGTCIHVMTQEELDSLGLGLEWVTDRTDYFAQSRVTPIGGMLSLMEMLDKYKIHNELYFDNYNIALVQQIGKNRGYKIDLSLNSDEIKPTVDASDIVTRVYPYGKNGLEISSVNHDSAYIDSPNIGKFIQHEGFVNFDEIDDPEELLKAGQALFAENNTDRIDIPKYSVVCNCFQFGNEVGLGDVVTVNDTQYGVVSKQRVVAVDYYPYEPNRTQITVGSTTLSLQDVVDRAEYSYVNTKLNTNERGEVKTTWLEMMQKNENITINNDLKNEEIALLRTGCLYEDPDGKGAVAIIKGRLAVASSKDDSGNWRWTTVMDAGQILVNKVFTGKLYTELVEILSQNGTLSIKDNLIQMYDGQKKLRFKAGYEENYEENTGKYVFSLCNAGGKQTAYLDDNGNLTICGIFKTGEEKEDRVVIDNNGIHSYDASDESDGLVVNRLEDGVSGVRTLALYEHGTEVFSVSKTILGVTLSFLGNPVIRYVKNKNFPDGIAQMAGEWLSKTHNHGITDGTWLATADGGSIEWSASSAI